MKTCYKCEKCGAVFTDYEKAESHENSHYVQKTWISDEDEKVISANTEYIPELYAPSAVVVPLERTIFDGNEWKTEVSYIKYYYSAKKPAEQVFPIDESVME